MIIVANEEVEVVEMTQVITLPRLIGSRASIAEMFSHLPDNLSEQKVILDYSDNVAASQGSSDETFKQIMVDRNASLLVCRNISDRAKSHLIRASELREHTGELIFE